MKQASKDLEVMHKPSQNEVTKRQTDAKALKRQLEAWDSLVEFRIHLEGVLSMGHRLPVAGMSGRFREADTSVALEADAVSQELRGLLGELQVLQGRLSGPRPLRDELLEAPAARSSRTADEGESSAWQPLMGE